VNVIEPQIQHAEPFMSPSHSIRLALYALLAMSLCACTMGARVGTSRRPELPGSAVHFTRPPVVDGSRRACLAPPYTPAADATALSNGTPVHRDQEGRRWTVSLAGDATPTSEQMMALLERLRARGGILQWVSYGLYCGTDSNTACLSYSGDLCTTNVDEVALLILAAIADDPVLPNLQLELALSLSGALGPRCEASDPRCVPTPYQGGTYDPEGDREAGPLATHSAGACRQDGDCVQAGCGNHCLSWEYGGAHAAATCEGYSFTEPIFCGCVERACAWFSQ